MTDNKPPAHERIVNAAREHPWTTISGIAAFAASLAAAWPLFVTFSNFYYTRADALEWHDQVERRMAWNDVKDARIEAILARNLVDQCRIKIDAKDVMSTLERRVCEQYEREFAIAQRKLETMQNRAQKLSGSKEEASK